MNVIIRTTKLVDLASIQNHPDNDNHGDAGAISESLARGQFRAIMVSEATGNIIGGNHVYLAAEMNNDSKILAHLIPDLTADDELRIMTADNQYARLAYTDSQQALENLERLLATEEGLDGTGFDEDMYQDMITDLEQNLADMLTDTDTDVEIDLDRVPFRFGDYAGVVERDVYIKFTKAYEHELDNDAVMLDTILDSWIPDDE